MAHQHQVDVSSFNIKDLTALRPEFTNIFQSGSFFIHFSANKLRAQSLIIESLRTYTLQI